MSVYDFNQNEHVACNNNNIHSGNSNTNGNQVVRYQMDNDFMNRNLVPNQQIGISVHLNRPTSKTAMFVRQRRAMLEQLGCFLCKGYLIDATTIDECMDSFCKSCIVIYLRTHNNCPKCGTLIHKTNPLASIRSDKVLQDIVYKLVPGLYDDEMKRRRDYYRNIVGSSSSEDDDEEESSSSFLGQHSNMTNEQFGIISHPKQFYKPTDSIDLSIEPHSKGDCSHIYYDNKGQSIVTCFTGNRQRLSLQLAPMFSPVDKLQFKTYLRCPAKLTAHQLKRFIAAKFNICKDDTIHLLYLNETVSDEYSLIDIAYIYDWRGIEHMRLFYIIERDLTNLCSQVESQVNEQSKKANARLNHVGTSTAVVKRVCIDPHPKFYEVQSTKNETTSSRNVCGRSMRPRADAPTASTKPVQININATPQAPILRSSSALDQSYTRTASSAHPASAKEIIAYGTLPQEKRDQSQINRSMANAMEELNRLRQTSAKETRSNQRKTSVRQTNDFTPGINISLNSINKASAPRAYEDKFLNTYSRVKMDQEAVFARGIVTNIEQNNNIKQIVPFMSSRHTTLAPQIAAGPSQNALVTVASFTEARSNHVTAMGTTSASSVTGSFKNMIGAGATSSKIEIKSLQPHQEAITNFPNKSQATPQVAFSLVTERGITIFRRMPNQVDSSSINTGTITSNLTHHIPQIQAAPIDAPPLTKVTTSLPNPQNSQSNNVAATSIRPTISHSHVRSHGNQLKQGGTSIQIASSSNSSTSSGSNRTSPSASSSNHDSSTARHSTKVKPVYKTFVDPTKLKSPNFKKLGYTARH